MSALSTSRAIAQVRANYSVFSNDPFAGVQVRIPAPASYQIPPVGTAVVVDPHGLPSSGVGFPGTAEVMAGPQPRLAVGLAPAETARQVMLDADKEREQILGDIYKEALKKEGEIRPYRVALARLLKMDPDKFSLSQAVYEVENAYLDNRLSRERFIRALQVRAGQVRQILKAGGLSAKSSLSVNYAIQQIYEHANAYYDTTDHLTHIVPPLKYSFDDYMGEKDYTNMFASKCLATGSGQCHSLPLVYIMIAEQFGAKAWLSLAPSHSFIQFMDNRGRLLDYETTNGNIVSGSWITGSGYINSKALRNRTYLDTLSKRQLYARCLSDLLLGYLKKFEYDELAAQIRNTIVQVDPSNITVLLVDANLKRSIALREIKAAGMPKPEELSKYPTAFKAFQEMLEADSRVDGVGYQDMPTAAYQEWLTSIEVEKKRLATQKLQQRVKLEARAQRSSFQNKKN
ncbi:hypothetical protein DCC81_03515 [Chitinophaga parva]|uniref:Protein SirB1 N-terminal domain-containing protein n=1 Tax=Chitinophaga parva TaxID=2169414 RepID=A0A2T7BLL0_9BACT|nr:hypothetical protein [Chitinophaga parva]PUZ28562.1 hypothetical protein DCC81_03515 [Chitinophaga parva]